VEKLAKAPEAVRRLFEEMSSVGDKGPAMTDEAVERFLKIMAAALTADQYDALVQSLVAAKPGDTIDKILDNLEKAVAAAAKKKTEQPVQDATKGKQAGKPQGGGKEGKDKDKGKGKGKGKGETKSAGEEDLEKIRRLLASQIPKLDYSGVSAGEYRLAWEPPTPKDGGIREKCPLYGITEDGTNYLGIVNVKFTDVKDKGATVEILDSTPIVDASANELWSVDDMIGSKFPIQFGTSGTSMATP